MRADIRIALNLTLATSSWPGCCERLIMPTSKKLARPQVLVSIQTAETVESSRMV